MNKSNPELVALAEKLRAIQSHLSAAFDAVHAAYCIWELVAAHFKLLVEDRDVAIALQGLWYGAVMRNLQNPDPAINALQMLQKDLADIGEDLGHGYDFGDQTKCAVEALQLLLAHIPDEALSTGSAARAAELRRLEQEGV